MKVLDEIWMKEKIWIVDATELDIWELEKLLYID